MTSTYQPDGTEPTYTDDLELRYAEVCEERDHLRALLNTPETADWVKGVELEAAHQIERWGVEHDAGKSPTDWFWLIGYIGGRVVEAQHANDTEKAQHRNIATAAVLLNWFRHMTGTSTRMRPGIDGEAALNPAPTAADAIPQAKAS